MIIVLLLFFLKVKLQSDVQYFYLISYNGLLEVIQRIKGARMIDMLNSLQTRKIENVKMFVDKSY